MRKRPDEEMEWLRSPAARAILDSYAANMRLSLDALIAEGAISSDPKVRQHATGYLVWKAAIKEMEVKNESDN